MSILNYLEALEKTCDFEENFLEHGNFYSSDHNYSNEENYRICDLSGVFIDHNEQLIPIIDDPAKIEAITIHSSIMERFPGEIFGAFLNLTYFSITKSLKIPGLQQRDFQNAGTLKRLKILNNEIEVVGSSAFSGAFLLEYLNLRRNGLKSIESSAFEGLEKLEALDISDNNLVKIHLSLFKPLKILGDLNASENKFEAKVIEVKSGIPSLERLAVDFDGSNDDTSNYTKVELENNVSLVIFETVESTVKEASSHSKQSQVMSNSSNLKCSSIQHFYIIFIFFYF